MRRGFTILESLLAAFLLIVIFFTVVSLYPVSLMGLKRSHDLTTASNVANAQMENWRSVAFANLNAGTTSTDVPVDGTVFHVKTTITSVSTRVKGLDVQVTWDSGPTTKNATPSSLDYQTRVYDYSE